MATETQEEQQVRDYLKRAEVRTMRKDLKKLRESDALKERDKIANQKTTEEVAVPQKRQDDGVKQVLEHNEQKEREAEKDLKKYADEGEKQQIFLSESERVGLEDEIKNIETKKEPEIAIKKNEVLLHQKKTEEKLNSILEEEKKRENEENFIGQKEQQSTIPSEKKSLEERRSELEAQRQEIEKRRWGVEKEISEIGERLKNSDYDLGILSAQKNKAQSRIKEIDGLLRTIYSGIISREEERRKGELAEQRMHREELAKVGAERKEQIQREQWTGSSPKPGGEAGMPAPVKGKPFLKEAPDALKARIEKSAEKEEEQRKQFLKNIEEQSHEPR